MLIDNTIAVVGSLALTALSLDFRREVALIVQHPAAVATLVRVFDRAAAARQGEAPTRAVSGDFPC